MDNIKARNILEK